MTSTAELRRLLAEAKAENGHGAIESWYPAFNAYVQAALIALPALLDRIERLESEVGALRYALVVAPSPHDKDRYPTSSASSNSYFRWYNEVRIAALDPTADGSKKP